MLAIRNNEFFILFFQYVHIYLQLFEESFMKIWLSVHISLIHLDLITVSTWAPGTQMPTVSPEDMGKAAGKELKLEILHVKVPCYSGR